MAEYERNCANMNLKYKEPDEDGMFEDITREILEAASDTDTNEDEDAVPHNTPINVLNLIIFIHFYHVIFISTYYY